VERSRLKLEFEQAELQIEQREKDKELARHDWALQSLAVEAANDAVRRREIVSPIDGIVVSVFPKVGEWVREGDPVVRIVSLKQLRVDGYLNIREYAPHEVRGRKVTVTAKLTGDKPASFSGTLVFAHPETQGNGEYRVKAIVDNRLVDDEYLLRPGLVVDMKIHMNEPKVRISAR
jgi:macrolide-specific efflux system membrane fusion protein